MTAKFRAVLAALRARPRLLAFGREVLACALVSVLWAGLLMTAAELLRGDFAVQGRSAAEVGALVRRQYPTFINATLMNIAWAYVVIGAGLAALAALVFWGWDGLRGRGVGLRPRPGFLLHLGRLWLLAGAGWLGGLLYGMARSPQLYVAWFYERGGFLRALQERVCGLGARTVGLVLLVLALPLAAVAGRGLWRWARPLWAPGWQRRWGLPLLVGAGIFSVFVVLRWVRMRPAAADGVHPNILILAADSVRPDHLSAYGYGRPTPQMDRIAARGVRFDQAYVSLPRTFPSWVTLLTGTYPTTHGLMHMFPRRSERKLPYPALPQRLADQGYAAGVVGDYAADVFSRVSLGFTDRDVPTLNMFQVVGTRLLEEHRFLLPFLDNRLGRWCFPVLDGFANDADAGLVADRALHLMDRLRRHKPFFEVVFFSNTHFPYAAPDPHYRRYSDPAYQGPDRYSKRDFIEGAGLPAAARQQVVDLYDGAIAAVDEGVGRVLDGLEARGLAQNTIVVLLADHGEDLYEPGRKGGHGDSLLGDESTHIPLFIADPRLPGPRVVKNLVRDVDLAPTLAAAAGLPPVPFVDGVDLGPLVRGEAAPALDHLPIYQETDVWLLGDAAPADRIVYPEITTLLEIDKKGGHQMVLKEEYQDLVIAAKHRALRTERWKLILAPLSGGRVRPQLFDLASDPGQQKDVAAQNPDVVAQLSAQLRAHVCAGRAVQCSHDLVVAREPEAP